MDDDILDEKIANTVAAQLKLEPLVNLDPNDQPALLDLVEQAYDLAYYYDLETNNIDVLRMLSMAFNQWGDDFHKSEWVDSILTDTYQNAEERVTELYLYVAFQHVGPQAIDFSAYSILRWQREFEALEYKNVEVHAASQQALEIAAENGIDDLLSTYTCVEILLHSWVNFMEHDVCAPIKSIFQNAALSGPEKAEQGKAWLVDNIEQIHEQLSQGLES